MERLLEALPFLVTPFAACLVIAALHCYMGLHVLKRGVIFVDLALAQSAALGAAVALLVTPLVCDDAHHHHESSSITTTEARLVELLEAEDADGVAETVPVIEGTDSATPSARDYEESTHEHGHKWFTQAMSLAFALLGALLLAFARLRDERIPHEAIIGIIFVVCAALSVLILSKAPHGHEKMEAMLIGSILFVRWPEVAVMLVLYAVLGAAHVVLRRPFVEISKDVAAAERSGRRVRLWDCLFYGLFALMVTQSVGMAGVLVVFSYLIIPAACAMLFADGFGRQLLVAWMVAAVITVAGLILSAVGDLPTGASLVSCCGVVLVVCVIARNLFAKSHEGVT